MSHTQAMATDIEGAGVDPPTRVGPVTTADPDESTVVSRETLARFTAEQVEKARREERDKLQKDKERLKQQTDSMKSELEQLREFQQKVEAERLAAEKKEARRKKSEAEKDMSAKEILARREQEWEQERERERNEMEGKLAAQERAMQQRFAQMELERQHMELQSFRQQRIAQEQMAKTIAPQLIDYINGNSPEEIEASIALAKQKTEEIQAEVTEGLKNARQFQGVSLSSGPSSIGTQTEVQAATSDEPDFTNMSYADYVKNRPRLMMNRGDQGLFS